MDTGDIEGQIEALGIDRWIKDRILNDRHLFETADHYDRVITSRDERLFDAVRCAKSEDDYFGGFVWLNPEQEIDDVKDWACNPSSTPPRIT